MNQPEADDVALKLLHTADWHLGRRFPSFREADETKLTRARVDVLDKILAVAEQRAVDAVLCAGDLFDEPSPDPEWWQPVAKKLAAWRARIPHVPATRESRPAPAGVGISPRPWVPARPADVGPRGRQG